MINLMVKAKDIEMKSFSHPIKEIGISFEWFGFLVGGSCVKRHTFI